MTNNERKIRVTLLETGETQSIPEPESLKAESLDWFIAAWLPDNTRFIVNVRASDKLAMFPERYRFPVYYRPDGPNEDPAARPASVWIISVLGKAAQKLRDNAYALAVSPDGAWIAFGANPGDLGEREIWRMDVRGQHATKLFDAPDHSALGGLNWSPDGQQAVYFQFSASGGMFVRRDLRTGATSPLVSMPDWKGLTDFLWLRGERLIYANECNFWEVRTDAEIGKGIEKPRQLTSWTGTCIGGMSVTSDSSRLAFQRWTQQKNVSLADIDENGKLQAAARHFLLNEHISAVETWTRDSKAIVFRSVRNGHLKLFRQALDSDTDEPLLMGTDNVAGSAISPDGKWLFYLACGTQAEAACEGTVPVMAIPAGGGASHQILTSDTYGRPRCPLTPGRYCVFAEQSGEGKPLTFTGFDALHGRGPILATFPTEAGTAYNWGLSADGTRIAVVKAWDSHIHIISLTGQVPRRVDVKPDSRLALIYWTADGNGWFALNKSAAGVALVHIDRTGFARRVWDLKGGAVAYGVPSPDGRHLAIVATGRSSNVWLMENF